MVRKTRNEFELKVELEAQYTVQKPTAGDAQIVGVEKQEHVIRMDNSVIFWYFTLPMLSVIHLDLNKHKLVLSHY